jgi:nitrate reductase beta subunit
VPADLPASVDATVDELDDLYRLLAIAKYDDRYVIPPAHAEDAGRLGQHEQLFCSLDTEGGPGMGGTGPYGVQSYSPTHQREPASRGTDGRLHLNVLGEAGS